MPFLKSLYWLLYANHCSVIGIAGPESPQCVLPGGKADAFLSIILIPPSSTKPFQNDILLMKWWITTLCFILDHNDDLTRATCLLNGRLGEREGAQTREGVRSRSGGPRLICNRARGLATHGLPGVLGTNQRAQRRLMVLCFHRDDWGCKGGQCWEDVQMVWLKPEKICEKQDLCYESH